MAARTAVTGSTAKTLAGVAGAVTGTVLLWLLLRRRWRVPQPVWIVLAALAVSNVISLIGAGLMLSIFAQRLPDILGDLSRVQLLMTSTGGLVSVIASAEAATFCASALAFALRRRGPVSGSRTGRVLLWATASLLVVSSFGLLWMLPRIGYELSAGVGEPTIYAGGQRVQLVRGLGYVEVPQAWRAEVATELPPAPAWMLVPPAEESPLAQSVIMRDNRAEAPRSYDSTTMCMIGVFTDRTKWQETQSEPSTEAVAVTLPNSALAGRSATAYRTTRKDVEGTGWHSTLRIELPDEDPPCMVTVRLRHLTPEPPSTAQFLPALQSIHLER